MEFINTILHFLTDKTKRITHKATLVLFVIAVLILTDNIWGFSYYYNNEKKISQVREIHLLLKDSSLTKTEAIKLNNMKDNIINHYSIKDYIWDLTSSLKFETEKPIKASNTKAFIEEKLEKAEPRMERNYYLQLISSSWFWLIAAIIIPLIAFFDKNTPISQTVLILLIFEPIILGFAWLTAKLYSLIPVIDNNPWYNYLINVLLSFLIAFIITLIDKYQKRKLQNNSASSFENYDINNL